MIIYEWNGKEEKLKSLMSEITIGNFEKIMEIEHNEDMSFFDYYLTLFNVLGLSKELIDNIDVDNLIDIIKDFKNDFHLELQTNNTFTIDGYNYVIFEDEFKLTARQFANIEKIIKKYPYHWVGPVIAYLAKREDLTQVEHDDTAHINYKTTLFRDKLTMDFILPIIKVIVDKLEKNLKIFENDTK